MLSRVADCLFWMSRYIERAENNARILDVNLQLMLDFETQSEADVRRHWSPIINSLEEHDLFHTFYEHANSRFRRRVRHLRRRRIRTRSIPASPAPAKTPAASASRSAPRCGSTSTQALSFHPRRRRARPFPRQPLPVLQAHPRRQLPVPRRHRRHHDPRRGLGLHPTRQVHRAHRPHLAHPRREVSHPAAQRRARRRQRRHRAMDGRAAFVQRARSVTANFTLVRSPPGRSPNSSSCTTVFRAPCAIACIRSTTRSIASAARPRTVFPTRPNAFPASCAATSIIPASQRDFSDGSAPVPRPAATARQPDQQRRR